MSTLREESKQTWDGTSSFESIDSGSLQRIADAVEKMAVRHTELMNDVDRYKQLYRNASAREEQALRRIAALKGVITKLRRHS